ncbi:ATP phosphoribosyltransferase regulatory subunit [Exiguobacterium sp.]|uniref:ATP phosphoribosyltransferase regulatory subunit n=1 Tax=Exiguobacterium sp. TaxID=44751 RepID=UPI003919E0B6
MIWFNTKGSIPEGWHELEGEDVLRPKRWLMSFLDQAATNGYSVIEPPLVEYYSHYQDLALFDESAYYRLFGNDGELLVMRPDYTLQIARKLADGSEPMRVAYAGAVYRRTPKHSGQPHERLQLGLEWIDGESDDTELIESFLKMTERIMPQDGLRIQVGSAALVAEVAEAAGIPERTLRQYLALRNLESLRDLAETYRYPLIAKLPFLIGDSAVAELRAEADESLRPVIDEVERAVEHLRAIGLNASYDFGQTGDFDYYSGLTVTGTIDGRRVLSGGRYDSLYGHFGQSRRAFGLSLDLEQLGEVMS